MSSRGCQPPGIDARFFTTPEGSNTMPMPIYGPFDPSRVAMTCQRYRGFHPRLLLFIPSGDTDPSLLAVLGLGEFTNSRVAGHYGDRVVVGCMNAEPVASANAGERLGVFPARSARRGCAGR